MFKLSFFLLLGFLVSVVHAQQKVPVQEGMEVTATVSSQVLNRIAIENDRIVMVKGITGQFEFDKDPELGQIFLKPIATDKQELIHLFLTTENGHTYPLSLVVETGPAKSILLVPLETEKAVHWEQSSSYETLLRVLVQAMVNQSSIEGFSLDNHKSALPKIAHTKIICLQTYQGHQLQGQILEITNTSQKELTLTEQLFLMPGVRAVAILNPLLSVRGKTRVYVVR